MPERSLLVLILGLVLTGCAPATTPTPTPTPARLATTPALERTVSDWVVRYAAETGLPAPEILVLPPQAAMETARSREAEVAVTGAAPPQGWFVTPLDREGIAVIVHPSNTVRSFSLDELADLFSGRRSNWEALGGADATIQPVIPLPGDEVRLQFEATVLGDVRPYPGALIAPTPQAAAKLVAEDPAAIGYLPLSQVTSEVRTVRVQGILPGASAVQEGRYPLRFEILATAPQEPEGPARDWLAWLQRYSSITPAQEPTAEGSGPGLTPPAERR